MRKYNIDIIKVLAIFLVLFLHFDNPVRETFGFPYHIIITICSTAVPLFLVSSGYLTIEKNYSYKNIFIKIIKLLILATLYKFLTMLAMGGEVTLKSIADLILDHTYKGNSLGYDTGPFWYIYAYIAILIMQPVFSYIYKNTKLFTSFSIIVIFYTFVLLYGSILLDHFSTNIKGSIFINTFPLKQASQSAFAYYLIGGLFKKYEGKIKQYIAKFNIKKFVSISLLSYFVILIIGTLYVSFLNNRFEFNLSYVTYNYRTMTGLFLTVIAFTLMNYLMPSFKNKVLLFISKNTLGIYFIHIPLGFLIKRALFNYDILINPLGNLIITIILLTLCCLIIYGLKLNKLTAKLVE
ncbi:acyltransferase [Erysipelotrichaceae bacterium OttesenSCG-928-M19]|nr:acyltransferase [Erysipelotrichaceae bacterium OttesenSCG-928-M19]